MTKYSMIDNIATLLRENGAMTSHQIYERLYEMGGMNRRMPTRSSIGSMIRTIKGVYKSDTTTGYTVASTRTIVVWDIDLEVYEAWKSTR